MSDIKVFNEEIIDFKNKQIQVVPQLYFNQYETIQQIYFYHHSKFQSGEFDAEGDKKYFYNIVKNPCKVYTKMIDFDTKDIRLLTAEGSDPMKTWYMERDLKFWMKDKQFGKVLNRIFRELPIFGSVVIKMVNGTPMFVDLRSFVVEQSADSLLTSNYIIEIHNYTIADFRTLGKKMGWKNTEEVIKEFRRMKNRSHITVLERYGEIMDDKENWSYRKVLMADVGVDEVDQMGQIKPYKGIELSSEEISPEDIPYWEFHLDKIPGRWLGVGAIEALFEVQIAENENTNLSQKGAYIKALLLLQTQDHTFAGRNLLAESSTGQVFDPESPITQIDLGDRNLAFFNEQHQKWMRNRDELTFAYDVVQGERLPSGTPLGSAQIAASAATSYFDQVREDVALDVKEFIYSEIIPQFEKDNTPEHILRIAGQDLDKVNELIISQKASIELFEYIKTKGALPDKIQFDMMKAAIGQRVKEGKELLLKMPRNFYKDVKYAIDIDITGESKDTRVYAASIFAALQAVTADPSLLQDPVKKQFFSEWLESQGIRFDLGSQKQDIQTLVQNNTKGSGGGVSTPNALSQPIAGQQTQTL